MQSRCGNSSFRLVFCLLEPPGLVHQLLKQTLQPNVLRTNASNDSASVSAQLADDGSTAVVRLANIAVNTSQSVLLKLSGATTSGELWTMASTNGDILQCNTPGSPKAVAPVKSTFVDGDLVHLPPASLAVIVLKLKGAVLSDEHSLHSLKNDDAQASVAVIHHDGQPRNYSIVAHRVLLTEAASMDGAVAIDGSPGSYHIAKAPPTSPNASKFHVHLQGGGWCWSVV